MKRKGFTLVELLVVIVILGLIMIVVATTAFPAMNKAKINSLETYTLRVVEKAKERCISEDCKDGTEYTIMDLMGENAEKGYKGFLVMTDTKNEYKVSGSITSTDEKFVASISSNDISLATVGSEGYAYNAGDVIYFNPNYNVRCSKEEADLNKNADGTMTGIKTDCMKWYVIETEDSKNDKTIDIILDHNATYDVSFSPSGSNYSNSNAKKEVEKLDDSIELGGAGWTEGLSPRLISADEIAAIVGANSDDTIKFKSTNVYVAPDSVSNLNTQASTFYLDGLSNTNKKSYASTDGWNAQWAKSSRKSNFTWLYNYTYRCIKNGYGCEIEEEITKGYWTSSVAIGQSNQAYAIGSQGKLRLGSMTLNNYFGIRPVITVSKAVIYK